MYGGVLVVHGLLNTFANRILAFLNGISVIWHVLGELCVVVLCVEDGAVDKRVWHVLGGPAAAVCV